MLRFALVLACVSALSSAQGGSQTQVTPYPVSEFALENGLRARVASAELKGEVTVFLAIAGAGCLAEPPDLPQLATLTRQCVVFSTSVTSQDRALVVRLMKEKRLTSSTGPAVMSFSIRVPAADLDSALGLLASWFFDAKTDPTLLGGVKSATVMALTDLEKKKTESDDYLCDSAWAPGVQIAFHHRPQATVKEFGPAVTPAAIEAFHDRTFRPERAMLSVVGTVEAAAVRKIVETRFGRKPRSARPGTDSKPSLSPGNVEGSWDLASHQLLMLWPLPPATEKSRSALEIAAQDLPYKMSNSGEVAHLAKNARGDAHLVRTDAAGFFSVQLPLRSKSDGAALAREVSRLLTTITYDPDRYPVSEKFGLNYGRAAGARMPPGMFPTLERNRILTILSWGESVETHFDRIGKLTADDVHAAIKTWLAPEKATIVTIAGKE